MPTIEYSTKIQRYKEHRQQLVKFSNHNALAPKYALFSELILLWLDAKKEDEPKLWACLLFFMGSPQARRKGREEYEISDFTEESPIDQNAKQKMTAFVTDFLKEDDEEESDE